MKNLCLVLILLVILPMAIPLSASAVTPLETIQTSVNKVLELVRDPALKAQPQQETKEKRIWGIIDGVFDYTELSKRTLAQHWRAFTPEQQKEFSRLFGKLLGGVYMDRIMGYSDEKVVFTKTNQSSEGFAEVQSEVIMPGKSIPIHYRLFLRNDEWRVYDVVIEGVSLVQNYRVQFRDILAKKSPEDLIETLRKKVTKG